MGVSDLLDHPPAHKAVANSFMRDVRWIGDNVPGAVSWPSISWWVALFLGLWGAMLGIGQFFFAYLFLGIAIALCVSKLMHSAFFVSPKHPSAGAIGTAFLILIGIGLEVWTHSMSVKAADDAKKLPDLTNQVNQFRSQWQQSEHQKEIKDAILQAKLEDYGTLEKLANSMEGFAKATEGYTHKQFETSRMGDTQLLSFTRSVVSKIRVLGSRCDAQERAIFSKRLQYPDNFQSLTEEQRGQIFSEQTRQMSAAENAIRDSCAAEYRSQVQGDAFYARRELSSRLGPEKVKSLKSSQSSMRAMVSDIAIDGIFAGPDPIDDSANYLEMLANELAVEKDLKPK